MFYILYINPIGLNNFHLLVNEKEFFILGLCCVPGVGNCHFLNALGVGKKKPRIKKENFLGARWDGANGHGYNGN